MKDRACISGRRVMRRQKAITLIEILIAIAVLGALAAIALPSFSNYRDRALVAQAIAEIGNISAAIATYYGDNKGFPPNLGVLSNIPQTDPWGRPYQYLPIAVDPPPNVGKVRKDKNLHPLNTDYDLYSMGKDGRTQAQLTAAKARDDIVRADNGRFIGLATNH